QAISQGNWGIADRASLPGAHHPAISPRAGPGRSNRARGRWIVTAVYLLAALIGAAIAVFALQNISPVIIRFFWWQIEGALSLVVLLSVLLGIVLTSLIGLVPHWRLRSKVRQLENRLARMPAAEQRQGADQTSR